jgi:hypothetical protein
MRWQEVADNDLQEFKLKGILTEAINRKEWASAVKEARLHREP